MATCGYICPKCDGIGFLPETLEICDWCQQPSDKSVTISDEEWIKIVHESNCCSDIGVVSEIRN